MNEASSGRQRIREDFRQILATLESVTLGTACERRGQGDSAQDYETLQRLKVQNEELRKRVQHLMEENQRLEEQNRKLNDERRRICEESRRLDEERSRLERENERLRATLRQREETLRTLQLVNGLSQADIDKLPIIEYRTCRSTLKMTGCGICLLDFASEDKVRYAFALPSLI